MCKFTNLQFLDNFDNIYIYIYICMYVCMYIYIIYVYGLFNLPFTKIFGQEKYPKNVSVYQICFVSVSR